MMVNILVALLNPNPVISPIHPHAASPWIQSVRASCGNTTLTIEGYGAGRPIGLQTKLLINGKPLTGGFAPQLLDDLSHGRAVYRLQILCGRSGETTLRIAEGEKLFNGPVRYRSAVASIKDNRLQSYTGLQDSDANSYWFR